MKPYYETELGKLYHGDCLEIMPHLEPVDLVLTDPPYGNLTEYLSFKDTKSNLRSLISKFMPKVLSKTKRALITPGVDNIYYYPKPTWIMAWRNPTTTGGCPWGFPTWQPILCYGKDPFLAAGKGRQVDFIEPDKRLVIYKSDHPCPKPEWFIAKLIWRSSIDKNDTILDIFFGSGTLGVLCERLNRKWIGIEIEEKYCEIAAKRIENERKQLKLF